MYTYSYLTKQLLIAAYIYLLPFYLKSFISKSPPKCFSNILSDVPFNTYSFPYIFLHIYCKAYTKIYYFSLGIFISNIY